MSVIAQVKHEIKVDGHHNTYEKYGQCSLELKKKK